MRNLTVIRKKQLKEESRYRYHFSAQCLLVIGISAASVAQTRSTSDGSEADVQRDVSKAEILIRSGQSKLAIPILENCLAESPQNWHVRIALAGAYQKMDNDARALTILGTSSPPETYRPMWTFSRAFSLYRLRKYDEATQLLRALLNNERMRAPANFFFANCHSQKGEYAEALPFYEAAIRYGRTPSNRALNVYYYNYGLTLFKLAKYVSARGAFLQSINQYPNDPLPWYYLGRCEAASGHTQEAINALERSIKTNGSFEPAYYELAKIYRSKGDSVRARYFYGQVSSKLHAELEETQLFKTGDR